MKSILASKHSIVPRTEFVPDNLLYAGLMMSDAPEWTPGMPNPDTWKGAWAPPMWANTSPMSTVYLEQQGGGVRIMQYELMAPRHCP